ncbi:cyclin p4 [Perilla frutescens var. hirtella]|uniref:Cyclin n=1 Tax=Perilla frutescens var. hirtella TaxID=608512 RepID=A0AAD4P2U8_PERFH|nr:cyclin p4 [Perilla frutescens var. hirtella]KAH6812203.1 cyclin p4 [Perilla frutescens var. frutescens]KAH6824037.1 cyclin p4 [Perilla frutescens var. hirtella]
MESGEMMPQLIKFLSSLLQCVAESNDLRRGSEPQKISAFNGVSRPSISIQSYLQRIFKYANCSPSCYIIAYVYLDRFTQRHPSLPVDSFNVHRLLITSIMLSAKFMDDMYYNNAYYAKVGGISTREINFLEVDFLFGLGFHLNVTPSTFQSYCSYLQREMMLQHPHLMNNFSFNTSSKLYLHFTDQEDSSQQQQHQLAV